MQPFFYTGETEKDKKMLLSYRHLHALNFKASELCCLNCDREGSGDGDGDRDADKGSPDLRGQSTRRCKMLDTVVSLLMWIQVTP